MAVDLQLEWMTLEDFQRHLDGADEIIPKDPIPNSKLFCFDAIFSVAIHFYQT